MHWRSSLGACGLFAAAVAVALAADWWRARNSAPAPVDLEVPARMARANQVAARTDGPPPWPRGNCFFLALEPLRPDARWLSVVNMHYENFARVVRDLDLETVRVRPVGDHRCLVTDPRIPRNWLLDEPCGICVPPPVRRELIEAYP